MLQRAGKLMAHSGDSHVVSGKCQLGWFLSMLFAGEVTGALPGGPVWSAAPGSLSLDNRWLELCGWMWPFEDHITLQ